MATAVAHQTALALPGVSHSLHWEAALEPWLLSLDSPCTRASYRRHVCAFFAIEGVPQHLRDLTVDVLDAYGGSLRYRAGRDTPTERRRAPNTVNLWLAALRSFLTFARKRRWLAPELSAEVISDALKPIRAKVQRPYQVVERDEFAALLAAAAADDWDAPRGVALIALGLGAGLRVAELVALTVGDLHRDAGGAFVDVRGGKGRKDRQVPLSESAIRLVLDYLTASGRSVARAADREQPLFGIRVRRAQQLVTTYAAWAGLLADGRRITPHALRHSYALRVLFGDPEHGQPGAPLTVVRDLLGHASVATTGGYLDHNKRHTLAQYAPRLDIAEEVS